MPIYRDYQPPQVSITDTDGNIVEFNPASNSSADKGVALQNALLAVEAGSSMIVGAGDYLLSELGNKFVTGCTYHFNNSTIIVDNDTSYTGGEGGDIGISIFKADDLEDLNITGSLQIDGGGRNLYGLNVHDCKNTRIQNVTIKNILAGFYLNGAEKLPSNALGVSLSNCISDNADYGFQIGCEYAKLANCTAVNSDDVGFSVDRGNIRFSGCSSSYNTTGVLLTAIANGGHGKWTGGDINHCDKLIDVQDGFLLGYTFIGADLYGNSLGSSSIDINGSGLSFVGCDIATTSVVSSHTLSGNTNFSDCNFNDSVNTTEAMFAGLSSGDRAKMRFHSCKENEGDNPLNELHPVPQTLTSENLPTYDVHKGISAFLLLDADYTASPITNARAGESGMLWIENDGGFQLTLASDWSDIKGNWTDMATMSATDRAAITWSTQFGSGGASFEVALTIFP